MTNTTNKLVTLYFQQAKTQANFQWRLKVYKDIEGLLKQGVNPTLIENAISKDYRNYKGVVVRSLGKDNLIDADTFYYHPFLQVAPPPPTIKINEDGTFTESYSDDNFYLQMKVQMKFEDVVEYFFSRFTEIPKKHKRDIGALKHVYDKTVIPYIQFENNEKMNPLDLLLFTIDAGRSITYDIDAKLTNGILGLSDYVEDGLDLYREKITYSRLNDLDYVQ